MARGKQTCKILKEIRRQIAEANGIEFVTSECRYKGDCLGTCPKCEAEVRYLEQQLRARSLTGKAVALAGISAATFAMLMPMKADAQSRMEIKTVPIERPAAICANSSKVRGTVNCVYLTKGGSIATEVIPGATVLNQTKGNGVATGIDGKFALNACVGDVLRIAYIGFFQQTITVRDTSEPITVILYEGPEPENGLVVVGTHDPKKKFKGKGLLELIIVDEKGNPIDLSDVEIEKLFIDEDGNEVAGYLYEDYINYYSTFILDWNYDPNLQDEDSKPLKEVTLRITAKGYDDPVITKVKYPKRKSKKTIKFKHKKK